MVAYIQQLYIRTYACFLCSLNSTTFYLKVSLFNSTRNSLFLPNASTQTDFLERKFDHKTAIKLTKEAGFDAFTTTLFISPYQNHELICETAIKKAQKYNVEFKYFDFRPGFREGQNMAREIGLYRQKYCGCINSLDESDFKEKIYKSFEST